jgi:mRNA interferase HigB
MWRSPVSERNVRRAAARYPLSVASVERWLETIAVAQAANLMELRNYFNHVDQVGTALIFNVGGNNFRLVCCVRWHRQSLLFPALLTHAEYDRTNVEDLCR